MIAALFVERTGIYSEFPEIDLWDKERDARTYSGPHPVIAHPPCERWGRYWGGGPMLHGTEQQKTLGDDGGCFATALHSVRIFGGVLEHPEGSHAWRWFGLNTPPRSGGWVPADWNGGWTCCVEQGHYGHRSRKATWLYLAGIEPPSLNWGKSAATMRMDDGFHSAEERRKAVKRGIIKRLSKRERAATPRAFAELLIDLVRAVESPPAGYSLGTHDSGGAGKSLDLMEAGTGIEPTYTALQAK